MKQTNQPPFPTGLNLVMESWLKQFIQNVNGTFVPPPVHDNSTGIEGQISFDTGFFYVCTAPNTWVRVALTGGF